MDNETECECPVCSDDDHECRYVPYKLEENHVPNPESPYGAVRGGYIVSEYICLRCGDTTTPPSPAGPPFSE